MKSNGRSLLPLLFAALTGTALSFTALSFTALAADTTLPAGEYLAKGGWGTLIIQKAANGQQGFSLESLGANGHSCSLDGSIRNGEANLHEDWQEGVCNVKFKWQDNGIEVSNEQNENCRGYCGARASFDGSYLKPAAGCSTEALRQTRNRFKKLYDSKDYAGAERLLAPVLSDCKTTLHWLDELATRNDLALTQAKLGQGKACRSTLESMIEDAKRYSGPQDDNTAICDSGDRYLPPADCDGYLRQVRAAKTNLGWCERAGG
ncbi:hypothetical protein QO207_25930 [Pseudomonas sp. CAN2814]|uniref:hypothetical protein n=1 Tax=Pseudomonas sp. CAN1 TaxID=3046726 RepID=UPI0026488BA3|nr:hypothetical protein [Pseudomonas sp. CAN1]MDN6860043.1 hypothetical protein [Pseudomonas sp. CAN1]